MEREVLFNLEMAARLFSPFLTLHFILANEKNDKFSVKL